MGLNTDASALCLLLQWHRAKGFQGLKERTMRPASKSLPENVDGDRSGQCHGEDQLYGSSTPCWPCAGCWAGNYLDTRHVCVN